MRRLTIFVAILSITFCLILGAIRFVLPGSESSSMRLSVIDPLKCPMPCLLGLRPGVTTIAEAVMLLHESPYIDSPTIQALGGGSTTSHNISLQAEWRDPDRMLSNIQTDITQNSVIIENEPGRDLVEEILVHVNIRLGDFVLRFGAPSKSVFGKLPNGNLYYALEYQTLGLEYVAFFSCQQEQAVVSSYGSTFVLQPLTAFESQAGGQLITGWHGFSPSMINRVRSGYQCRP